MEETRAKRKHAPERGRPVNKPYMYIAIRQDLSPSQQIVQSAHAAIEASKRYHLSSNIHPSVIVLRVKNEKALDKFKEYVHTTNLPHEEFREPARNNEITSVAVYPVYDEQRKLFRKYRLL